MSRKTFALIVTLTLSRVVFGQLPDSMKASQSTTTIESGAATLPNSAAELGPDTTDVLRGGDAGRKLERTNGNIGEGYSLCDFSSGLGYHDYATLGAGHSGNWGPPTTVSHTGTMVKISRTTEDGIWTLTQTIAQSPADASAKVTMALQNNSGVSRLVWLARVADVDANDTTNNILDGSFNTAFGYAASAQKGLQLSMATANSYEHVGYATQLASKACSINVGYTGLLKDADGVIYLNHSITIGAGKTATVTLKYRGNLAA